MDAFKKQLSAFVPLLASAIIELESDLNEVECEIEICKAKIASCKSLLRSDKVIRDFLSENAPKFSECSSVLSTAIRDLDAIRTQFARFESELLEFKQCKFYAISQIVDERVAAGQLSVAQLPSLLADVRQRLKTHRAEASELSAKRTAIQQSVPSLKAQLNERRQLCDDLNEQHRQISAVLDERQQTEAHEHAERKRKEQVYEKEHQKHVVSSHLLKKQTGQLTEMRFAIRQSILEYVNKTKRLAALTEAKNLKIGQFKKYSREGVARLREKQADLKAMLAELDRPLGDEDEQEIDVHQETAFRGKPSSSKESSKSRESTSKEAASKGGNDGSSISRLQSEENVRFIEQQKGKNQATLGHLIDRLGYLDSLYDKLIGAYEKQSDINEIETGEKLPDANVTKNDEQVPDAGETDEKQPDVNETKTGEKVPDACKTDEKQPDACKTDEKQPDVNETKTGEKVPDANETAPSPKVDHKPNVKCDDREVVSLKSKLRSYRRK